MGVKTLNQIRGIWLCQDCYEQMCEEAGVKELWTCTIGNIFGVYICERCNVFAGEHLVDLPEAYHVKSGG